MTDRRQEARADDTDRRRTPRLDSLTPEDAARVEEVFITHSRFIESVARQHSPGPDHVPDIVQAVGVQLCRGLQGFREEANITTWLYRVTVNTAHDYFRAQQKQQWRSADAIRANPLPEPILDPDDQVTAGERSQALYDAVQRLKPKHQEQIVHELSESTVISIRKSSRRWAARRQLRAMLADDPRVDE